MSIRLPFRIGSDHARQGLDGQGDADAENHEGAEGGERTDDPVTLKRGVPEPLLSALQCAMLLEGVHLFHGTGLLSIAYGADEVELAATAFTRSLARLQDEGLIP